MDTEKRDRMDKITCGQCESGPAKGMKSVKCHWSGHMRTSGAAACEDYFLSSASSGLRCAICSGPRGLEDVINRQPCTRCKDALDDRLVGAKHGLCFLVGLLAFGALGVVMATAGRMFGWW